MPDPNRTEHLPEDQTHLVLLPKPPRTRKHPHDDAAEFINHIGDPEMGVREMNIALPPGWMSSRLEGLKDAPSRGGPPAGGRALLELSRRAWLIWNGLDGTTAFLAFVVAVHDVDRITVAPAPTTGRGRS